MVDKDRIKGSANQATGKIKEWAGKATGDKKTEAEGKADQVKGKVQNAVGGFKDALRAAKVSEDVNDALTGHAGGAVGLFTLADAAG